jgi:hypothetical protein
MKLSLRRTVFAGALAVAALAGAARSDASDHIDGLKTGLDTAADITDLFAFTSPRDPSKLVVALNVHTLALGSSRFSNAVDYRIRIRPIVDARALTPSANGGDERSITCSFSGGIPLLDARQRATCTLDLVGGKQTVAFDTRSGDYRAGGSGVADGARLFAGVRSDPWFLDLGKTIKYNAGHQVPNGTAGINGLWGQNVLSIVVEVDKARLPGPMLAVTGQTIRKSLL